MVVLVVVSKKATRHFAINIYISDLPKVSSFALELHFMHLHNMKSQSNCEDSDFKDAENVDENINFRLVAYLFTIPAAAEAAEQQQLQQQLQQQHMQQQQLQQQLQQQQQQKQEQQYQQKSKFHTIRELHFAPVLHIAS